MAHHTASTAANRAFDIFAREAALAAAQESAERGAPAALFLLWLSLKQLLLRCCRTTAITNRIAATIPQLTAKNCVRARVCACIPRLDETRLFLIINLKPPPRRQL